MLRARAQSSDAVALTPDTPVPFVGVGKLADGVRTFVARAATVDHAVLLEGETGTGKEVVARLIHRASRRATHRFVDYNCGGKTFEVAANELFGHEPEAFTGAHTRKEGLFHTAGKGVLFLDEIALFNPETQPILLRAVEQRTYRRLGGSADLPFEGRLIAATNDGGALRTDLRFRLKQMGLLIPPLRNRPEDIIPIFNHYLAELPLFAQRSWKWEIADDASIFLMRCPWKGNVRQIRGLVNSLDPILNYATKDRVGGSLELTTDLLLEADPNLANDSVGDAPTSFDVDLTNDPVLKGQRVATLDILTSGARDRLAELIVAALVSKEPVLQGLLRRRDAKNEKLGLIADVLADAARMGVHAYGLQFDINLVASEVNQALGLSGRGARAPLTKALQQAVVDACKELSKQISKNRD